MRNQTSTVEKKASARRRHQTAIEKYEKWLEKNPTAPKKKRVKVFDKFVDETQKCRSK